MLLFLQLLLRGVACVLVELRWVKTQPPPPHLERRMVLTSLSIVYFILLFFSFPLFSRAHCPSTWLSSCRVEASYVAQYDRLPLMDNLSSPTCGVGEWRDPLGVLLLLSQRSRKSAYLHFQCRIHFPSFFLFVVPSVD